MNAILRIHPRFLVGMMTVTCAFLFPTVTLLAALTMAMQSSTKAPTMAALGVPDGYTGWSATFTCADAISLYKLRELSQSEIRLKGPLQALEYDEGREGLVVGRAGGCATVHFTPEDLDLFVVSALAPIMEGESTRLAEYARRWAQNARLTAERAAIIAAKPSIQAGTATIFIGSDRKCSEQFVQAKETGGLEGRKKLAELISYGCGFVTESGIHIDKIKTESGSCQVRIANGRHAQRTGWVPCAWIK